MSKLLFPKGTKLKVIRGYTESPYNLVEGSIVYANSDGYENSTVRLLDHTSQWDTNRFEILELPKFDIQTQYDKAVENIGKQILMPSSSKTQRYKVDQVAIATRSQKNADKGVFTSRIQELLNNYSLVVYYKCGVSQIPYLDSELIEEVEVKLNSKYTAKVASDTITVGCQTFPISVIDELVKARNSVLGTDN